MPFPKVSMTQIAEKQVAVVVADESKLDHIKEHLVAGGFACVNEDDSFRIAFKNEQFEAARWLSVHGDIHDVSEVVRECWP
jgi:hypothetical protein